MKQVSTYKYLGSRIKENGRCEKEIRTRIEVARGAVWN